MRVALFLGLLALAGPSLVAQPMPGTPADSALAQAHAALRAGDLRAADRLADRADDPESAPWLAVRLELQRRGLARVGPPFLRRRQRRQTARRLLDADPTHWLAHDELGRQALQDFLFEQHHIQVVAAMAGTGLRGEEMFDRRLSMPRFARSGRFDLARLADAFPVTDSDEADAFLEQAERHLPAAHAAAPPEAEADRPLATLYVATGRAAELLALAETARSPDAPLWAAAARFRLGDAEAAADAFARVSPQVLRDLDDPARADPDGEHASADAFWSLRDPLYGTAHNERRLEHRTRVVEADLWFENEGTAGRETARGGVYVRYGLPDRRATMTGSVYPGDEYVSPVGGPPQMPVRTEVWEYERGLRYVFVDRTWGGRYGLYAPTALAHSAGAREAEVDDYVMQDRRLRREMPATTALRSAAPVEALATGFLAADGAAEAVVAARVEGATQGAVYPVPAAAPGRPSPAAGGRFARSLAVGASDSLSVEAATPGGPAWTRVAVPTVVREGGLAMSGVLLAATADPQDAGAPGVVVRGGTALRPLPSATLSRAEPVGVYVEAYGLAVEGGRARFAVEARLVPERRRGLLARVFGGGRSRGVSVALDATDPSSRVGIPLALDAASQRPGTYRLTVRITDGVRGTSVASICVVELQ